MLARFIHQPQMDEHLAKSVDATTATNAWLETKNYDK